MTTTAAIRTRPKQSRGEDWAPDPPLTTKPFPRYADRPRPGIAEIKPHKIGAITAGLGQLHDTVQLRQHRAAPPTPFLITYRYPELPLRARAFTLTAHLLEVEPSVVGDPRRLPRPGRTPQARRAWLAGLGSWHALPEAERRRPRWLDAVRLAELGPTVFGSLLEPHLRKAFLVRYESARPVTEHYTRAKQPQQAGPDVWWRELADFLEELSQELRWEGDAS